MILNMQLYHYLLENFDDSLEKKFTGLLLGDKTDVSWELMGTPEKPGWCRRALVWPEWKVDRSGMFRENPGTAEVALPVGDKGSLLKEEQKDKV